MARGEGNVSARDEILTRIRQAIGSTGSGRDERSGVGYRQVGDSPRSHVLELFLDRLRDYGVAVTRVSSDDLANAVRLAVEARGARSLALPPDLPRELLPQGPSYLWDEAASLAEIAGTDGVITGCALAIAETGTIVMDGGRRQGRRVLSLLPDYHLCIIESAQVVELVPEAVAALRPSLGAGAPVTFISGPSATSDIELIRVEGVHGPRTLEVLLVEDAE